MTTEGQSWTNQSKSYFLQGKIATTTVECLLPWPCRVQRVALPALQPHCSSADGTCGCSSCFVDWTGSKQLTQHNWTTPTCWTGMDIAVVTNATAAAS